MKKSIAYYLEDLSRLDELTESDLANWINEMPYSQPLYKLQELKMRRSNGENVDIMHQNAVYHVVDIDRQAQRKASKISRKKKDASDTIESSIEELASEEQIDVLSLYAEKKKPTTASFIDGMLMDISSLVKGVSKETSDFPKESSIDHIDLSESKILKEPMNQLQFGTDALVVSNDEIEHTIDFMDDMVLDIESLVDQLGEKEIVGIDPVETRLSTLKIDERSISPKIIDINSEQAESLIVSPVKEVTDQLASDELEDGIEQEVSEILISKEAVSIDTELSSLVEKYDHVVTDQDFILTYDDIMQTKNDVGPLELEKNNTSPHTSDKKQSKKAVLKAEKKKSKKDTKKKTVSKKKSSKKKNTEPLELVKEIRYVYLSERKDKDFRMHEYKGESDYVKWLLQKKSINKLGKKETKKKGNKKIDSIVLKSAERSVKKRDVIISETLADILAAQGHGKKAKKMYKQLSLIFPEKSAYFAAKIKKLKKD